MQLSMVLVGLLVFVGSFSALNFTVAAITTFIRRQEMRHGILASVLYN